MSVLGSNAKIINKNWWEVDQLEHATFPTDQEYHVVIKREAIPIVFVPGIMGSRLYNTSSGTLVWDPDDADFMKKTFLTWGGVGMPTPETRLKLLVGPSFSSTFLSVCGTDGPEKRLVYPGKHSDALRSRLSGSFGADWDWARKDHRVGEDLMFDDLNTSTMRYGNDPTIQFGVDPETNERGGNYEQNLIQARLGTVNGWAGIAWSFYGDFLLHLAESSWSDFRKCFYFPVYAFGYNWTDSNEVSGANLAKYIDNVTKNEREREGGGNLCNYVIVVTHSMGGLVARWASQKAGAKSKILGIVHGAQPVTGTPSAYHQFRAGEDFVPFWGAVRSGNTAEWGGSRIIGSDAKHIDPIFGHCPGPLELLPSREYKTTSTNKDWPNSSKWLFQRNEQKQVIASLPDGDPYKDIYLDRKSFLGFGADVENVLPDEAGGERGQKEGTAHSQPASAADVLNQNVRKASDYHDGIKLDCHPTTYYAYGVDFGAKTYDDIVYEWLRNYQEPRTRIVGRGVPVRVNDPGESMSQEGVDLDAARKAYFHIQDKAASGDGTVAASSATALGTPGSLSRDTKKVYPESSAGPNDSVIRAHAIKNVAHADFYKSGCTEAWNFASLAVTEIAQNYMQKKIGRHGKNKPLWTP